MLLLNIFLGRKGLKPMTEIVRFFYYGTSGYFPFLKILIVQIKQ